MDNFEDFYEAEKDHPMHMIRKGAYADYFGKDIDDLPNKKYKDEKSARKADLKYDYKEQSKKLKNGFTENPYSSKDGQHQNFSHYRKKADENDIDSKLTHMIGDNINGKSKKEKDRVEYARKKLLQRLGEDPKNTELFVKNYIGHKYRIKDDKGKIHEGKDRDDIHLQINKSTKGHSVSTLSKDKNDPYVLVHNSDKSGLKNIKGNKTSTNYGYTNNENVRGGQLHPENRSYYTIMKKSEANKGNGRSGKNDYILDDKAVKKFHFDPEVGDSIAQSRYGPKGDLSGKDVYITGKKHKAKQVRQESVDAILNIKDIYFMDLITESEKDDLILLVESDNEY